MAKIVIIASFADSLIKFRGRLLEDMTKNGQEVIACAPDAPDYIIQALKNIGVTYQDICLNRNGLNLWQDYKLFINLVRFLNKIKPDVLLTYTIKPNIYGSLAAFLARVPTVGTMITGLGHPFSESSGRFFRYAIRFLYRMALTKKHVVFFQNQDDLKLFVDHRILNEKYRCVLINGSGVCLKQFSPKSLPNEVSFLLIARLIIEKGVREYVRAAKIIKSKYPNVRFRLVGPFTDDRFHISRKELEQMIEEGDVEYVGPLQDVRSAIEESCVFVLPSYREGTPRSVLEAMAMSRPIITCNSPGCRETVIDGVNGYLVPTGDAEALAAAMEKFFLDPSLAIQMGAQSRRIAEEKYDVQEVNRVILESLGLLPEAGMARN